MCHLYYKCQFAIIISDSQQKYVVLQAIRRSGGISKILPIKKLKSKVYVSNKSLLCSKSSKIDVAMGIAAHCFKKL